MTDPAISDGLDALALLRRNQDSVTRLIDAYKGLCERGRDTAAEKMAVAQRLHLELTVTTLPQQEILGPPLRAVTGDTSLWRSQDASAWSLIAHLSMGEPGNSRFDGRLLVLGGELVRQYAQDSREALAHASGLDLAALGAAMRARQQELMAEFDAPAPAPEDESGDPVGQPVSDALTRDPD